MFIKINSAGVHWHIDFIIGVQDKYFGLVLTSCFQNPSGTFTYDGVHNRGGFQDMLRHGFSYGNLNPRAFEGIISDLIGTKFRFSRPHKRSRIEPVSYIQLSKLPLAILDGSVLYESPQHPALNFEPYKDEVGVGRRAMINPDWYTRQRVCFALWHKDIFFEQGERILILPERGVQIEYDAPELNKIIL